MDFHILGPLEVLDEGRAVAIGGSKQQALLALLLLHANNTLSTDRLIEELWGERAPATATKTVQVQVSRLRKALANGSNGSTGLLVTRDHGYQLQLDPERLDALRFERLVVKGTTELTAGQAECAAATLEHALELWRGPPLGNLAYEPFAQQEAARLNDLRIGAVEELLDARLALGRHAEVLGEIDALIAEHPYRERLRAQKMLALYRSDRQADALQVFQDARVRLVKDLGIEPGERLRRLEQAVLAQDPALALPPPLPPELRCDTPLSGRDAEMERLHEHWRSARAGDGHVVLVTGPPGIGKSRLAAELAMAVRRGGAEVRNGARPGAGADRPALVGLDDVDSLDEAHEAVAGRPVLVVATARAPLPGDHETIPLSPLDADGVRALAGQYARARDGVPVKELAAASGGNPRRLHRLAREWAHGVASGRVGRSAARAEEERAGLRSAEVELADDVVTLRSLEAPAVSDGVVACPFKGLASFDVEDADVFFGRERLVAELVARLVGAPVMGVVGPSGSGKSSALRAGLLAALAAGVLPGSDRWRLCLLRPGEHPVRALLDATSLPTSGGRTVIAVDQFEELFTACRDESERAAFVEQLVDGAKDRAWIVLVAVRADFYGRCTAYPDLARALSANHVLVGPMRRDELRRAIELPARHAGLQVDPALVDALTDDVEGEPGGLPLLSTTLLELWRHRDGRRLAHGVYEQSGGVHGAVARLAEGTYERLGEGQREIARRILLRLAGEGEGDAVVRRRVDIAELGGDGHDAVTEVLSVLASERLVTIGEGEVEVAHEALLREWPRLSAWLDEDAQGRRLHRHLSTAAREWDARGRDPAELYRGARLASVLDWATTHDAELNAAERTFVEESRAAAERSHRRLRAVLAGVCVLLALAVVAGVLALGERDKARDQAAVADAQRLGARALVEKDFDRALLLARQGVALDDRVETRGNLLATLLKSPAAIGIMRGGDQRFTSVALSPDERTLAAGDEFGRLVLFDIRTRRSLATLEPAPDQRILNLAYSPDGRHLAVSHAVPEKPEEAVALLDVRSRRVVRTFSDGFGVVALMWFSDRGRSLDIDFVDTAAPEPAESYLTRFDVRSGRRLLPPVQISRSPAAARPASDGRTIVVSGEDGTTVRDATDAHVLRRFARGFGDEEFATALSPVGRTLVAGGRDGLLRLVDLRTGAVRTASGHHSAPVAHGIVFTRDGRRVITPGDDGEIIVWDVATAAVVETFTGHGGAVRGLAITADGRTLYSVGADGSVFIWDLAGDRRLGRPFRAGSGTEGNFPRYALSSDGKLLAAGQSDGKVVLLDARTFRRLRSFPVTTTRGVPHEDGFALPEVMGMRFLPRSHRLVVGGYDGFLAIVDADSGRVVRRLPGHSRAVFTPGISADGRLMVTGSNESVRFWSLPDGRPLGAPLRFPLPPVEAQLSPDGRWAVVVTAFSDRLQIIDARTREVRTAKGGELLYYARFSPDGRTIAVGDLHGRTEVWSTATWRPITRTFAGHAGGAMLGAISPDNRTLVTGSSDGTLRLWDIKTEQPLGAPLPGLPEHPVIPLFTPDGTALIAAYDIGRAYRWDIRTSSLIRQACRVAGRRLTRAEWQEFLPDQDYKPAC